MGKKPSKKQIEDLRFGLGSFHPSVVVGVQVGELSQILDRLEKLEKRNRKAKRKAKPVQSEGPEIRQGDRVELVKTLETHLWPYVVEGAQGVVERMDNTGTHQYRVILDNSKGHALSFMESEIKKVDGSAGS